MPTRLEQLVETLRELGGSLTNKSGGNAASDMSVLMDMSENACRHLVGEAKRAGVIRTTVGPTPGKKGLRIQTIALIDPSKRTAEPESQAMQPEEGSSWLDPLPEEMLRAFAALAHLYQAPRTDDWKIEQYGRLHSEVQALTRKLHQAEGDLKAARQEADRVKAELRIANRNLDRMQHGPRRVIDRELEQLDKLVRERPRSGKGND